jgi:tRNA threonylcarbamoyladenosine biosynthesis protein TsaE
MELISHSIKETHRIAANLAKKIVKRGARKGACVVALEGELGVGKTTFTQGFVRSLNIKQKVKSPTFLLMRSYILPTPKFKLLYHIDCYRINSYKELVPLDIRGILKDPDNLVLIEWAERIKSIIPKDRILVHIDHIDSKTRKLTINHES